MVLCNYASKVVHYHSEKYYAERNRFVVCLEGNTYPVVHDFIFHYCRCQAVQDKIGIR